MMLRSASTPVLGSLLSSISESPNCNIHIQTSTLNRYAFPTCVHHNSHKKLSFHQTISATSCNSSPMSPSVSLNGIRRAQSESNLEALLPYASCNNTDDFEFYNSKQQQKLSGLSKGSVLETIQSFSFYNSRGMYQDEEEEDSDCEEEEEEFQKNDMLLKKVKGEEKIMAMVGSEKSKNMGMVEENRFVNEYYNASYGMANDTIGSEMYLARGLGVDGGFGFGGGGGGMGGGDFNHGYSGMGDNDGDKPGVEEYYKKSVEENPGHPLFLRNYAQFLYQTKKDLQGAEEYYSRAILADPQDGDVLCQYAKIVWELHRDKDRALSYFERAVQASPEDSHVHAAYASFIWEIEDDEDEEIKDLGAISPHFLGTMASAVA